MTKFQLIMRLQPFDCLSDANEYTGYELRVKTLAPDMKGWTNKERQCSEFPPSSTIYLLSSADYNNTLVPMTCTIFGKAFNKSIERICTNIFIICK